MNLTKVKSHKFKIFLLILTLILTLISLKTFFYTEGSDKGIPLLVSAQFPVKTFGLPSVLPEETTKKFNKVESLSTLEAKYVKEHEFNVVEASGRKLLSGKLIYEMLIQRGVKIDESIKDRLKSESMTLEDIEMIDSDAAQFFTEEENFKMELKQYKNFGELKNVFEKRSHTTGVFYGTEMLNEPMAYRNMKFEDVKSLLDSGAVLPENVMEYLVYADNTDLVVDLKNAGYNIKTDYMEKLQSANAIELLVDGYAINPYTASANDQISKIKNLVNVGAPLKVDDGTRDALDRVLEGVVNQNSEQAQKLLELAKNLHELGLPLEQSHFQLLEKISHKYPDLYNLYARDFPLKHL